jgi:RNA polymerase sigma-70 factor (ECF subfamily)
LQKKTKNSYPEILHTLLVLCKKDDRRAIQQLYEMCFPVFMPICRRYHNNDDDARSSYNNGLLKIVNGLKKVEEQLNFWPWAKRIIVNTLIDEYRKRKIFDRHILTKETERELDAYKHVVVNDAEDQLNIQQIMKLIESLPETTRLVFNLYAIEGYNHREIFEKTGLPEGTSKWHLSMARKILIEKIQLIENQYQKQII